MRALTPQQVAEQALSGSDARDTIVIVSAMSTLNTRWARNRLTSNGDSRTVDLTVAAIVATPEGLACTTLSQPAAASAPAAFARQAASRARSAAPAPDAAPLPAPPRAPGTLEACWDDDPVEVPSAGLAELLAELGEELATASADGLESTGYLEVTSTTTWLATSTGLRLRHHQPEARLEVTLQSADRTRSTWHGHAGADLAGMDLAGLMVDARQELRWQERDVSVAPGRHPAVLSPSAVGDLMVSLYWDLDGRAASEGRNAFGRPGGGTRLGESLTDRRVDLFSDPTEPEQHCSPFLVAPFSADTVSVFDNGMPLRRTEWLQDGRLGALVTSRHSAAETGLPVHPPVDNLIMDADGLGTTSDLVARTADGLLVTCTWYNRMVDPQRHLLTGLTRDGVYVLRDGEVIGRAANFRFNESPVDLLGRITDASRPEPTLPREVADYFPRTTMPALAVSEFNFSTVSSSV